MNDASLIFQAVADAHCDPSDNTITLVLKDQYDLHRRFDMALGMAGPMIAAISMRAADLNERLPENQRQSAPLVAEGVFLSQSVDGNPALVLTLRGGTLLPLEFHSGDLTGLAQELLALAHKAGPEGPQ